MYIVTFYLETSDASETDLQLATRVSANNWRKVQVQAKKALKVENPGLNLAKI